MTNDRVDNKYRYYKEVKKDITYFRRTHKKAKMHFNLNGMNAEDSAKELIQQIDQFKEPI